MRVTLAGVFALVGLGTLVHTTIAVIQSSLTRPTLQRSNWLADRQLLKLSQEDYLALPASILLELAVGAVVSILGGFMLAGPLKQIIMPRKGRCMEINTLRTDHISFNTRSRAIPLDVKPL